MGLAGERTGWAVRGALILLVVTLTRSSSEDNSNSNVGTSTRGQSTQTGAHGSPDIKISKTPATSVTSKSRLSVPTKPTDIDNVTTLMPICANATLNMDQNSTDCNGTKPTNTAGGGSLIVGMVGGDYQSYVRAFYVVVAVTGIALVYLGVKFYMTRRRKNQKRHYGVINNQQLNMDAVEDLEDDDVFDQSKRRLIS